MCSPFTARKKKKKPSKKVQFCTEMVRKICIFNQEGRCLLLVLEPLLALGSTLLDDDDYLATREDTR